MRKQMKIAAVVSATALLAIGASFTSMAAAKTGTWKLEDDGWYCYDKDGDVYENEFCLYEGKEYYVGDDGLMESEMWLETEDGLFYVDEFGAKVVNAWMDLVPEDSDEEETERYYFGSKGAASTGKKVIDGKTYYFNEDGEMLTGWVDYAEGTKVATNATVSSTDMVFVGEDGARVGGQWIYTYAPEADEDNLEDEDQYWYWIKSTGKVQTGRNLDIDGRTYFFSSAAGSQGQMLSGWVYGEDLVNSDGKVDTFYNFTNSNAIIASGKDVFFCGTEDQGYAKKNTWIETWAPETYAAEDSDNDQFWYWVDKNGKLLAAGTASSANALTFVDGEATTPIINKNNTYTDSKIVMKEINNKTYAFKNNGQMWSGLVNVNGIGTMYFGASSDGAMKTGSVMIADQDDYEYKFFFAENSKYEFKKGAAVTGNANGDLYIGGLLQTTDEKYAEVLNVAIAGSTYDFLIDADGDIRTSKKVYKDEDGNVVKDATNTTFETANGFTKGSY